MKGKNYDDIPDVPNAVTNIFKDIPQKDIEHSFNKLLDRENSYIATKGTYIE